MANTGTMSMLSAVKDVVVGRAIRLMSDPRLTKMMTNPRVMNAAMKAMSLGGNVKAQADKATRVAAGVFGLATQDEISQLRSSVQQLEDEVATLRIKSPSSPGSSGL